MKIKKILTANLCLCISLFVISTTVFAGTRVESFGAGESVANARLDAKNAFVEAYTLPMNSFYSISVQTRALYENGATSWDKGRYISGGIYAVVDAPTLTYAGESNHSIDGFTKYLYCSYG